MKSISIIIVDDHPIVRRGLGDFMALQEDFHILGMSGECEDAKTMVKEKQPDILLLDIHLPDGNSLESLVEFQELSPRTRIVILTSFNDESLMIRAFRLGAQAYILKDCDPDEMIHQIRSVYQGQVLIPKNILSKLQTNGPWERLSQREWEVLRWIEQGLNNSEIAERLYISEGTVKTHVSRILSKLELSHRTQAAIWMLQNGSLYKPK